MNGIFYPWSCYIVIYVLLFSFPAIMSIADLRYDEINYLNASCSSRDSCFFPRKDYEDNLVFSYCECKASCARYRTCCIDSPYVYLSRSISKRYFQKTWETCSNLVGTASSIFAVNRCYVKDDRVLKSLCEDTVDNLQDPIAVLPVTSKFSSTTYKNYFCAMCNGVTDINDLVFWSIRLESMDLKEVDSNSVLQKLTYDTGYEQWGIKTGSINSSDNFTPLSIAFDSPSIANGKVRRCVSNLISDCDPYYADAIVRRKCSQYMGMIYATPKSGGKLQRFRNIHCAICNYATYGSKLCTGDSLPGRAKPSLSFTLLLDVNTKGGDKVGINDFCNDNEVYDPFFKKCRALVCTQPGFKIENSKCVQSKVK